MSKWYLARVEKEPGKTLKCLRFDRGREFTSNEFEWFCNDRSIKIQTSAPRTPPQNGVAERRNRSIMHCVRTLMMEKNVALKCSREAVSIVVYMLNRVQIKKGTNLTPYELWFGHAFSVKYFKIFGSKCYILKDNRNSKLDAKGEEGILLDYSTRSKAYKCLNTNTNKVVESVNVKVDDYSKLHEVQKPEDYRTFIYYYEGMPDEELEILVGEKVSVIAATHTMNAESHWDIELQTIAELQSKNVEVPEKEVHSDSEVEQIIAEERRRLSKYVRRHHPIEQIIGDKDARPIIRRRSASGTCLESEVEPKTMKEALDNEGWIIAMNEEIKQIERNKAWSLVPKPADKNVIGTKWVFRNKLDENGEVIRNKLDQSTKAMLRTPELTMAKHLHLLQDWKE